MHVWPGQPVTVTVDSYPGLEWRGTVESISPAAAQEFQLLPAQNTSGNWVKVVQRIPMRVRVDIQCPGVAARARGCSRRGRRTGAGRRPPRDGEAGNRRPSFVGWGCWTWFLPPSRTFAAATAANLAASKKRSRQGSMCFSSGRSCVVSENVVAVFGRLVTGEASFVQRLVARFAVLEVGKSPAASRGVLL